MVWINTLNMNKIIFRTLALIIALITVYSQVHFQNLNNLLLFLGFMCSLLAFAEYDSIDFLKKFKYKEMTTIRISTSWIGKFFEILSFVFYVAYYFI